MFCDFLSSDKPPSTGVSQGSTLGLILFILFINDYDKAVQFSTVYHFQKRPSLAC